MASNSKKKRKSPRVRDLLQIEDVKFSVIVGSSDGSETKDTSKDQDAIPSEAPLAGSSTGTQTSNIPTPSFEIIGNKEYDELYGAISIKRPLRKLFKEDPNELEEEEDYNLDTDDEEWLRSQPEDVQTSEDNFAKVIATLEKISRKQETTGNRVCKVAQSVLKVDDKIIENIYKYWFEKRERTRGLLMPVVPNTPKDNASTESPFIAFRKTDPKRVLKPSKRQKRKFSIKNCKLNLAPIQLQELWNRKHNIHTPPQPESEATTCKSGDAPAVKAGSRRRLSRKTRTVNETYPDFLFFK